MPSNNRDLSSQYRSPFARRILKFLRSFDPIKSAGWLALQIGATRQQFSDWMYSKGFPTEENVQRLAQVMRKHGESITCAELARDVALSRNWIPPKDYDNFAKVARAAAAKEHWPGKEAILPWLDHLDELWKDPDSVWAALARDTLLSHIPTYDKALRLAHILQARERDRG